MCECVHIGGRYTYICIGEVSARGMARRSGVGLKLRTRRGGLSQPLSQCKHVLIEIRSSGYNSFADVAARPPFAHPTTPSPSTSVLASHPPPDRYAWDRNLINFTVSSGASRFSCTAGGAGGGGRGGREEDLEDGLRTEKIVFVRGETRRKFFGGFWILK